MLIGAAAEALRQSLRGPVWLARLSMRVDRALDAAVGHEGIAEKTIGA